MRCRNFAAVLVLASGLRAQTPAPEQPPVWWETLQRASQEVFQAPLGSLDRKVEDAWQSALQTPQSQYFVAAAGMVSGFYQHQGYDLKAEKILRQTLSAVPENDPISKRLLNLQLASLFENTRQLVKAAAIRETIAKQPADSLNPEEQASDIQQLARIYEQMGEMKKAEASLKEAASLRARPRNPSAVRDRAPQATFLLGREIRQAFARGHSANTEYELAQFYQRHGRTADAETILKRMLDNASRDSPADSNSVAHAYISFLTEQKRFDEAVKLAQECVARVESSANPETAIYQKQELARILTQAGKTNQALAIQQDAISAAPQGGASRVQALNALAQWFLMQNRLEEAERVVNESREAGAADQNNGKFHDRMALHTLAQIRDRQGKPDEAQNLRDRANAEIPVQTKDEFYSLIASAQQAMRIDTGQLMAITEQALAALADRVQIRPQDAGTVIQLVQLLLNNKKEEEAQRVTSAILRMLEEVSPQDHPQIADALSSTIHALTSLPGMAQEVGRAVDRQEKILLAAKGPESLALDAVTSGRVQLLNRNADFSGVLDEQKRRFVRTEKATGPKSTWALQGLNELAWAHRPVNNWPEEERVWLDLLGRTEAVNGKTSSAYANVLQSISSRYGENRQFDEALAWMDKAIEVARQLPDSEMWMQRLISQQRSILQMKNMPVNSSAPANPFYQTRPNARWFNTPSFTGTAAGK